MTTSPNFSAKIKRPYVKNMNLSSHIAAVQSYLEETETNTKPRTKTAITWESRTEGGGSDCGTPTIKAEPALLLVAGPPAGVERERRKEFPSIDAIKPPCRGSGTTTTL